MYLPEYVSRCITGLEQAGFAAYAVGGCVRDALLGRCPQDYDLCTEALPAQIRQVFSHRRLVLAGEKHGTVGVIDENQVVEITTFRTEGDYQDNRHPNWVRFVDRIEEDLSRRDFTVNAMAYSPTRGFADPYGGREDLKNGVLRAVGDPGTRFREDSLRILRGARFAARYDLTPEAATEQAMVQLAPLMENLARERVFEELCKLLIVAKAQHLQRFAPLLTQVIPELAPTLHFNQKSRHHTWDLYTHTVRTVEEVPPELSLRWAALLHDLGKPDTFSLDDAGEGHYYGHAARSAELANAILLRLKAPTQLRERVVFLIEKHMSPPEAERKFLRRWLSRYGTEALQQLLQLQRADVLATGTRSDTSLFQQAEEILGELLAENTCLTVKNLALNGRDLLAMGFPPGPSLGKCLAHLLTMVVEEQIPNTPDALRAEALTYKTRQN